MYDTECLAVHQSDYLGMETNMRRFAISVYLFGCDLLAMTFWKQLVGNDVWK